MRHITPIFEWILCARAITGAVALIAGCDGVGSALCRLALGSCLTLAGCLAGMLRAARGARDTRSLLALVPWRT
jgi:hypothetical protein